MKSLIMKIYSYLKKYWKIVVLVLVLVVGMFLFTCEDKRVNRFIENQKEKILFEEAEQVKKKNYLARSL